MKKMTLLSLFVCLVVMTACADRKNLSPMPTISEESKRELAQPVNCATARGDIAILEEERASVGKRMLAGVRSLMPIAAAAGILLGDYRDRAEVATGKYNDDLEAKISQIKRTCRIK